MELLEEVAVEVIHQHLGLLYVNVGLGGKANGVPRDVGERGLPFDFSR